MEFEDFEEGGRGKEEGGRNKGDGIRGSWSFNNILKDTTEEEGRKTQKNEAVTLCKPF